MATHLQRTVSTDQSTVVYTPFGQDNLSPDSPMRLRFNGEYWLPTEVGYPLGDGHRMFNPKLMRFSRPDTLSPFGKGGINAYTYCENDPINNSDPSGRFIIGLFKRIRGVHRNQLYRHMNYMERNPSRASRITKMNSLSEQRHNALGKLIQRDYVDSEVRVIIAYNTREKASVEIANNPGKYSETELHHYNSKIDTFLDESTAQYRADIETQKLFKSMKEVVYQGKKRYYLPTVDDIRQA